MKIVIELPDNWLDIDKFDLAGILDLKRLIANQVKEALIEQYLDKTQLPPIEIDPKEVKDQMLTILAERALRER